METPLNGRNGRPCNFNELHSFNLSNFGTFIKRKGRKNETPKIRSNVIIPLSQCEARSELRSLPVLGMRMFKCAFPNRESADMGCGHQQMELSVQ
ncbi:hypothetical protein AVEN_262330-1 [Araneus ventricosus]|uniref:Uncharacterized protein n=1 Tax=Araneus ventricosus TaxID=182803 RepID=A0A4Y2K6L8_ARAVE|nr:hypothetical protein AVEN_262330-1 [Araneus ventricosus]